MIEPGILATFNLVKINKINIEHEVSNLDSGRRPITMQSIEGFVAWAEAFGISTLEQVKAATKEAKPKVNA